MEWEKNIYVDQNGREWVKGGTPSEPVPPSRLVCLPFLVEAMHPVPLNGDTVYSVCAKCGESLDIGVVALVFHNNDWGVRIACKSCSPLKETTSTPYLIPYIASVLRPHILRAWETVNTTCNVCTRPRCTDAECVKVSALLEKRPAALEHFYNVSLDVITPLIGDACVVCGRRGAKLQCKTCRMHVFCGKRCKAAMVPCTESYREIWWQ